MISLLLKCAPGSVIPQEGSGYIYPNAKAIFRDMEYDTWEVYLMMADEGFQPQAGDTVLAGWNPITGEVLPEYPINPDLLEFVQPIGNAFNPALNTYDGTVSFPVHHSYLGQSTRFWGAVNEYPDDNQARRILAYRFETDFAGQMYQRVRFILGEPFDKDHTPNALAILIYTDPERQNYFYTPGAFILDDTDPDNTFWYADTTIGQSPTGTPEPVHYAVALGSSPLNGGGTIPADWSDTPTHHSFNWEKNLIFTEATQEAVQAFEIRMGWLGYTVVDSGDRFIVDHPDFPLGKTVVVSTEVSYQDTPTVQPKWMSDGEYEAMKQAFKKAEGLDVINSAHTDHGNPQ